MNNRIDQLDSLRGLAALVVFFGHLPMVAFPILITNMLKALGLINGHASVILFFVLSGFVLSIPFFSKNEIDYAPYLIKRIYRVYIPYIAGIVFAIILSQVFFSVKISGLGDWSNKLWTTPMTMKLIIEHIYLIGNIHSNSFNGVIWSLIHEMRISIIFPFVVLFIKRFNWKISVLFSILLSFVSGLNNIFHFQISNGFLITYFDTINYLSIFILGALIAKHKEGILKYYSIRSFNTRCLILAVSFAAYNYSGIASTLLYKLTNLQLLSSYSLIITECAMALGSVGFIISSMGSNRVAETLLKKPFVFLGKISYSLYLFHLPLLLSCVYLFHGKLSLFMICAISAVLSISLSTLAWHCIERPCMNAGRNLAYKFKAKKQEVRTLAS